MIYQVDHQKEIVETFNEKESLKGEENIAFKEAGTYIMFSRRNNDFIIKCLLCQCYK